MMEEIIEDRGICTVQVWTQLILRPSVMFLFLGGFGAGKPMTWRLQRVSERSNMPVSL